jgi:signal transduction histidine kinase
MSEQLNGSTVVAHDKRASRFPAVRVLLGWREWSVSVKFAAMLLIPLVVALSAGAGLVWTSATARVADTHDEEIVRAEQVISGVLSTVQTERALAAVTTGPPAAGDRLTVARADVNSSVAQFESLFEMMQIAGRQADAARGQLARLDSVRGLTDQVQAIREYSTITAALLDLDSALLSGIQNAQLSRTVIAVSDLARAHEYLAEQQSLVDLGLSRGSLGGAALGTAYDATALASNWLGQFTASAPDDELKAYSTAVSSDALNARNTLVGTVLDPVSGFHAAVPVEQWRTTSQPVVDKLHDVIAQLRDSAVAAASTNSAGSGALLWALAAGLIAAGLVTGALITVIVRHLRGTLGALQVAAIDIAKRRLPEALLKVRDGLADGTVKPELPVLGNNEFGAVAVAFEAVCGEAIRAAAEQAEMRAGYSQVFVNVFRRSQTLVQRQLRIVEQLERDEQSSQQLAKLFQLDHLVTRMRRNNENVLVLSGTELTRRSTKPIPVSALIQAGISEIEQYQRVEVVDVPAAKIIDSGASDLIRILAELLDNATSFSPPETIVTVHGAALPDGGLSIAVLDNGIGMSDEEIGELNERLTRAGSTELAKSRQVGLLVVGRLAGRHGFGVELLGGKNADGVTAVITVPADLVAGAPRADQTVPQQAGNGSARELARLARAGRTGMDAGQPKGLSAVPSSQEVSPVRQPAEVSVSRPAEKSSRRKPSWQPAAGTAPARAIPVEHPRELVEMAHADVPKDLPVRKTSNRAAGAAPMPSAAARAASGWFRVRNTADQPREVSMAVEVGEYRPRRRSGAPENWSTAADEGWNVVETKSRAEQYTYTEDGLPIRERGAQLLPGSAGRGGPRQGSPPPVDRDPAHTRSRLSSYQQGVQKAKGSGGPGAPPPKKTAGWKRLRRDK